MTVAASRVQQYELRFGEYGAQLREDGYLHDLETRGDCFVALCRTLLEPDALPALIHCAMGKDRTGVSVALLLAVAGVDEDVIADDYALTDVCVGDLYIDEGREWLVSRGYTWEEYGHVVRSPAERMLNTFVQLERRWGGPVAYLMAHGLTAEEVASLRELLTEPVQPMLSRD